MKRQSYIAAVATAAVIGTTGGAATALRADEPSAAAGRPGSGAGASTASTAEAAPLWATPGAIHDGDKVIEVKGMGRINSVRRLPDGGYLATEPATPGSEDPAKGVYRVSPEGQADLVTFIRGVGDVNADGTRFVGLDLKSDRYVVRDIATGRELAEISVGPRRGSRPTGRAAYLDTRVATEWRAPKAKRSYVYAVTPSSDESPLVLAEGLSEWNVSAEGGRIAGNRPNRDPNADSNRCAVIGTLSQKKTIDCGHWFYGAQAAYSPDGSRLLAVPALTDGFGPGRFDVLNSWDGSVEAEVDLPDWAQRGAFLDEDTLMVKGATDGDGNGTVIYTCELDGQCRETARSEADAVLGITG
ncbi:hypothetical protein K8W59_15700 [Nocardioides rotundus]|uniref:hypothetical protein n=1 Tax=Nocardioides rotundus TaxID=1774216 RepID=UPI001CBC7BE1|nr:hypothetical protein [Nocardioides rotundus]UAL29203.1 hypothetical protein K8W59_15700 [Nocardioides rotundus]